MRKFWHNILCFFLLLFYSFIFPSHALNGDEKEKEINLQDIYIQKCNQSFAFNEQLPVVRKYARECSSVVEIGKNRLVAGWGILKGLSESSFNDRSYLGIILVYPPRGELNLMTKVAKENEINCKFWEANDLNILIEPTDMLSIDSSNTYSHLTYELENFSPKVRKYICLCNANDRSGSYEKNNRNSHSSFDQMSKDLFPAVVDFLANHPEWILLGQSENSQGFTVLQRINDTALKSSFSNSVVDHYLKNKIILCTGPSLGRYDMLKKTTEADLNLIPFKKIFVTTNEPAIMGIKFNEKKPDHCYFIPNRGKQIDCTNCIISTMRNAVNDPEVLDDDILLFKHESVFINDMDLIKKAINKIANEGYNMVKRTPPNQITATDAFFIKVSAIRDIIKKYPDIEYFPPGIDYCEMYFHMYIVKYIPNVFGVNYDHNNGDFTELGFYHYPTVGPYWPYWDKKNRDQLFK